MSVFNVVRPIVNPIVRSIVNPRGGGFAGLLNLYPGAAAAYSLRALSSGWLAGDVVEVRPSHGAAAQSFTASQITSGAMLDFVNGGTTDLYNSARYFNGTSTVVTGTHSFSSPTSGYVEAMVNITDGLPLTNQRIYSQGTSLAGNNFLITLTTSGTISVGVGDDGGGIQSFTSTATISSGEYLIRATFSGGNFITINVNGVLFDSGSITPTTLGTGNYSFAIGRQSVTPTGHFKGIIYGLNQNNQAAYTGLGTSVTAWEDTIGSNDGTETNGAAYTGQPFDGFVSKWYDQSGNGNDAIQITTTSQPKIVSAGALVTGGIDFDGVDDFLITSKAGTLSQPISLFQVFNSEAAVASDYQIDAGCAMLSGSDGSIYYFAGSLLNSTIDFPTSGDTIHSVVYSGASSTVFADGVLVATGNTGSNAFTRTFSIGARKSGVQASRISYKEIIIYNFDESANRAAIETNINAAYSIYA